MSLTTPTRTQLKARRKQEALDRSNEVLVVRNLMSTPAGRRWMWFTLELCGLYAGSENLDPQILAHKEGKRALGLYLLAQLNRHCPADYIRMTQESTGIQLQLLDDTPEDDDDE